MAVTLRCADSFGRRALEAPAKATTGIFGLVVPVRAALHSGIRVLAAAAEADIVRDGSFRNAWFAHRGEDGAVTHVEIRGPDYKGSLRGGTKTLFRFGRAGEGVCRLAVTEAPIDALSLAAIEGPRADTLHVATGGGIGPGTISALQDAIRAIAGHPDAHLVAATDANRAGDRYAERLGEIAAGSGIQVERLRPIRGTDWNDMLRGMWADTPNASRSGRPAVSAWAFQAGRNGRH